MSSICGWLSHVFSPAWKPKVRINAADVSRTQWRLVRMWFMSTCVGVEWWSACDVASSEVNQWILPCVP